jgi:hypothetical protein
MAKTEAASPQINQKKFNALASKARSSYKEGRAIAEEFGAAVAEAAEHDHLNKKAFAMFRSLDRLEPEKLADVLEAFAYYCDIGGLDKRASEVMRMPLEDDDAGEDDEDGGKQKKLAAKKAAAKATGATEDPKARTSNVKPFPGQVAGQAAE